MMEAGRELDALVAGKVMDLLDVGYYRRASRHNTEWEQCERGDRGAFAEASLYYVHNPYGVLSVPAYSTDIAAAWQVVEKVAATVRLEDLFVLALSETGKWEADFGVGAVVQADTAPHAICLAALKAVEAGR